MIDSRSSREGATIRRRRECTQCGHRFTTYEEIEREELTDKYDREVPGAFIGECVMSGLREVDEVAYVRFASVYRRFQEATDFVQEVKKLEGDPP